MRTLIVVLLLAVPASARADATFEIAGGYTGVLGDPDEGVGATLRAGVRGLRQFDDGHACDGWAGLFLAMARDLGIEAVERNLSITEMHTADEVFTTGTMGELSPVLEVDGRRIGDGAVGPVTTRLRDHYWNLTQTEGEPLPF